MASVAPTVAFIGLGAMGRGMAGSVLRSGVLLRVFDVRPEASQELVELGATRCSSPRECAEGADVLVLAVLNAQQVSSVLFEGEGAVFSGAFSGVCVVCATLAPAFVAEVAGKVEAKGAAYVDAPMSGGTARAAEGSLTFMVSAKPDALGRAQSVVDAMGKPFIVGDRAGLGSGMKLVNQMLAGSHIVLAAEAMAMSAKLGLDTRHVFEIISTAAGGSWMFANRVPHMLDDDPTVYSAIDIWPKDLGIVMEEARRLGMPVPMAGQALQQYFAARGLGLGSQDDSKVVRVYEALSNVTVAKPSDGAERSTIGPQSSSPELMSTLKVGFMGLGAMGRGMAKSIAKTGCDLSVYDIRPEASTELVEMGAAAAASPLVCAKGKDVLVVAVINAQQVNSVLFDGPTAVFAGDFKGVCLCCATISPSVAEEIASRVAAFGATFIDLPMSGGTIRAAQGQLTFMASGAAEPLVKAAPVIGAMGKAFVVGNKPGLGSGVKMVNQMLAGSHIVLAAEAMAMSAKLGLDARQVFEVISTAAGSSWMFENRVPHILDDDGTVHSAIAIWPKDLGIVMDEAKRLGFPAPMTMQALQQYLAARGLGLDSKDDSLVVRVYEALSGISVAHA